MRGKAGHNNANAVLYALDALLLQVLVPIPGEVADEEVLVPAACSLPLDDAEGGSFAVAAGESLVLPPSSWVLCEALVPLPAGVDWLAEPLTLLGQVALKGGGLYESKPAAVDWEKASIEVQGSCAAVSDTFYVNPQQGTLQPSRIASGSKPPNAGREARLCNSTRFTYTAVFGPWGGSSGGAPPKCGTYSAYNVAEAEVEMDSGDGDEAAGGPSSGYSIMQLTVTGEAGAAELGMRAGSAGWAGLAR